MRLALKKAIIVLSVCTVAMVGTVAAQSSWSGIFGDVPTNGTYYAEAVERLARMGVLTGYGLGRFGPHDSVSRAQLAVALDRYDRKVVDPLRRQIRLLQEELDLSVCGDGQVQEDEQCDDGNTRSGDGCSASCMAELDTWDCPSGYSIGESYQAADGCNTCTCTAKGPVCTEIACSDQPIGECFSSAECSGSQVCSTIYGDCLSACQPGQPCIQACAGTCIEPRNQNQNDQCDPYICPNGTRIPACTPNGNVINYVADPCRSHGRAECGNGVCEEGERGRCERDCKSKELSSCEEKKEEFSRIVRQNSSCNQNSDCQLVVQSCPYVTCGAAVNSQAVPHVTAQAEAVVERCEREGEPLACAGCIPQEAVCEEGTCVVRSEIKATQYCGDGICQEGEAAILCPNCAPGAQDSECRCMLSCPEDCAS